MNITRAYFLVVPLMLISNVASSNSFLNEVSEIQLPANYGGADIKIPSSNKQKKKIAKKKQVKNTSSKYISDQKEIVRLKKLLEEASIQNAQLASRAGIAQDMPVNEDLKKLTIELDKKDRILKALQLQVEDLTHKNAKLITESKRIAISPAVPQEQSKKG
ncbi:hypothetical protein [Enterobacter mori]|uniref:hypothetical protein n=1 Tax=Enterobacter mori TaxID=539813 RepID=UPI0022358C5E|nr:hypothetical protein [Enterobacter mori]MCW4989841.1 hypothetical protein [Enterobacter mori]